MIHCQKIPILKLLLNSLLINSGTEVESNYVEAQAGSSKKDFANYLYISLKCANESKFWLAILRDTKKGDQREIERLLEEIIEIANILGASLFSVKDKR